MTLDARTYTETYKILAVFFCKPKIQPIPKYLGYFEQFGDLWICNRSTTIYDSASQPFSDCRTLNLNYFSKSHTHIISKFHVLVVYSESISDYLGLYKLTNSNLLIGIIFGTKQCETLNIKGCKIL